MKKTTIASLLSISLLLAAGLAAGAGESQDEDPARFNYFVNDWNVIGLKDYELRPDHPG